MTQAIVERGWQPHCGQCWDPRGDAQASRRPRTSGRSVRRGAPPDRFWSRSRTIGRSSDMKWRPASRSGSREASRASSCKATSSGAPPSWTPSASATLISAPPSKYPPEAVRHYAAERWRPSLDVGRLADRDGLPRAVRRHYLRAWGNAAADPGRSAVSDPPKRAHPAPAQSTRAGPRHGPLPSIVAGPHQD
jgi:hypothetical protein